MNAELLLQKQIGDTLLQYRIDHDSGMVELKLIPADAPDSLQSPSELTPLASVKFAQDDPCGGFAGGHTLRCSETMSHFTFERQECETDQIKTILRHANGCRLIHHLSWQSDRPVFFVHTELQNCSEEELQIELLESFALGGIGETLSDQQFADMKLHRFRSRWCNEANLETATTTDWLLERYPLNYVICNERYGQVGTLPTSGFHPFGAVEDTTFGILWGAMLGWSGSWQMEFSMRNAPGLALSGGLADAEFGHWQKTLLPGEILTAPTALIGCVTGTLDDLCDRLIQGVESTLQLPDSESDLPIVFNEWCTSWGNPSEQSLLAIAEKLQGLPIRYLVMDAGWYQKDDGSSWSSGQGDWQVNQRLFPAGMAHAAAAIRAKGFIPGVWFEAEIIGSTSDIWETESAHMLHRNGRPITVGSRRFWNLNDPAALEQLDRKIVHFLKENHLGYIKVDYNATVGIGCDHPDSPGEGLRRQVLGTHRFFKRLHEINPELVIENCASGGHRLEPAMFALSSMSSFSDAHELDTIPVIAASLHRLMPVRQMQIWAVMRAEADLKHIAYLLSSAMLGRLCLSGDILQLSPEQFGMVATALQFYRKLTPVLKSGKSMLDNRAGKSRKCLTGSQFVTRISRDGNWLILWCHVFCDAPRTLCKTLPDGDWNLTDQFAAPDTGEIEYKNNQIILTAPAPMSGRVLLFKKENCSK